MQTETLDKLYLEWAQFTNARTERELYLCELIRRIAKAQSWESQAVEAEKALAFIENRDVEDWVKYQEDDSEMRDE